MSKHHTDKVAGKSIWSRLFQCRKEKRKEKIKEFSRLSNREVAELSTEQKLDYLEALMPQNCNLRRLFNHIPGNEEKLKACLFNLKFPTEFWNDEKILADRYAALIARDPQIIHRVSHWTDTDMSDKKQTVKDAVAIFNYVYGTDVKLQFFTTESFIKQQESLGFHCEVVPRGYAKDNTIFINEQVLKKENFCAISTPIHEGIHIRQKMQKFQNQLLNRMFSIPWPVLSIYEDQVESKNDISFKDFYSMSPVEVHAYGIQKYVEDKLKETCGIKEISHSPAHIAAVRNKTKIVPIYSQRS